MTYSVKCLIDGVEQTFTYTDCTDAVDALHKFMQEYPDYDQDRNFVILPVS